MATPSKAQYLTEIQSLLKRRYKPKDDAGQARLTVLEAVALALAHEGSTRERARQVLDQFKSGYFDWNEVRASTIEEIRGTFGDLPDSEARAQKLRRFLRQLFEKTYGFTLEPLTKKPLKDSLKVLGEYEAFGSDFVQASVTQHALGGHAIPVDGDVRRAMERLGVAEPGVETHSLRSLLERAVPKNRGAEFVELIEDLAHDTCVPGPPDCPRCELRKICPTGQARKEEAKHADKQAATRTKAASKEGAKVAKAPVAATAPEPSNERAKAPKAPKGRAGGHA